MRSEYSERISQMLVLERRRSIRDRVLLVVCAMVALLTAYALMKPAMSLSDSAYCGHEEHQHDAACYADVLVCELPEGEAGVSPHVHDDSCYQVEQVLVCSAVDDSAAPVSLDGAEADGAEAVSAADVVADDVSDGAAAADDGGAMPANEDDGVTDEASDAANQSALSEGDAELRQEAAAHVHGSDCYVQKRTLVCDQQDAADPQVAHTHSADCYESELTCGKEEHVHDLACYSNSEADLETPADWEASLPSDEELTGVWAHDVLLVAESQLGYTESRQNYIVDGDGNVKGYTRYGDWYGDSYGDWCAMFVSFCLHYADVYEEVVPRDANCQKWIEQFSDEDVDLWRPAGSDYEPQPGDLIFFDWNPESESDHVGLVYELIEATETEPAKVKTIEGNAADRVQFEEYELDDPSIMGYAQLPEKPEEEPAPSEDEVAESDQSQDVATTLPAEATEHDFAYQDERVSLTLHVKGVPAFDNSDDAQGQGEEESGGQVADMQDGAQADAQVDELAEDQADVELQDQGQGAGAADQLDADTAAVTWDQADLVVTYLSADSDEYRAFSECASEREDAGSLLDLAAFDISLYVQGKKLDLSQCVISVDIAPAQELIALSEDIANSVSQEGDPVAPEVEIGLVLTAMQGGQVALDAAAQDQEGQSGQEVQSGQADSNEEAAMEMEAFSLTDDLVLDDAQGDVSADPVVEFSSANGMRMASAFLPQEAQDVPVLTMSVNASDPIAFAASQVANPKFQVQYYAYLDRVADSGDTALPVIDTSNGGEGKGGNLPQNTGEDVDLTYIYLEDAAVSGKKEVATEQKLTQVYNSKDCEYIYQPNISYFNRLYENGNYALKEIWILREGCSADSVKKADWVIYEDPSIVHFTNRAQSVKDEADNKTLLISDDDVIRLVFDTSQSKHTNAATFHDYDITNGKMYTSSDLSTTTTSNSGTVYTKTDAQGINSSTNYSGSGTKLAFGNENTGTGLYDEAWNGNYPNKYNAVTVSGKRVVQGYGGCTFGLASGLGSNGSLVFSSGINAPNIFGSASAKGKTSYSQYGLTFDRDGDTYTLSAVTGTNVNNLQYFNNPVCGDKTHTTIWTNNFWPMDSASSYGASGHDLKFGNLAKKTNRNFVGSKNGTFPVSDDGVDHNSYFGMQYGVKFNLSEDYCGPLEYYFFGDDDMWVFLTAPDGTTELVCDIGGVHSSVGEYVDLWDYIKKGSDGEYQLNFFYTERGASGSSCYMRFTLPSVSSITPEQNTGMLTIEKQVTGDGAGDTGTEFDFTIKLRDANGNALLDDYAYVRYSPEGEVIEKDVIVFDGGDFRLRHGEYVVIGYLPIGTTYTIEEVSADGYITSTKVGSAAAVATNKATGSITQASSYAVVYENELQYELPDTGGRGVSAHVLGGSAALVVALLAYRVVVRRNRNLTGGAAE